MFLTDALRLQPGMSVAFVGAGGKSAALACLVREGEGRHPVVITTTTKIGREQSALAGTHIVVQRREDLEHLALALGAVGGVLVTGPSTDSETKWRGPDPGLLQVLAQMVSRAGGILGIEADGARGSSLKVPAAHEPDIPGFVDVVSPIVGIDVLGTTLQADKVHRPEDLGRFLGIRPTDPIEVEHVVRVLTSVQGSLKGVPASAEIRLLINKAANFEALERAAVIARQALGTQRVQSVLAGNLLSPDAVERSWGRPAAVVLAAGGSTRLAGPKPLLTFRGQPLIRYGVDAALGAGLSPLVVVLGHAGADVRRALEGTPARFVDNLHWKDGQSSSLRMGLAAVQAGTEGVVFFLADMPFVSAATVGRLVERHSETLGSIVAPAGGGRRGNPVLFDRRTFGALQGLTGDTGGRAVFDRFDVQEVPTDVQELMDVDDPADVDRLRSLE
jgi:molybdenum cofactor cytidylyltransferase